MKRSSRIHPSEVGFSGSQKVVYDDLQVGAGQIIRPGVTDPTWRQYDYGLGGITYSVLGYAINDYIDYTVQTRHGVKLSSLIDSHIHWCIPSDSIGDKIKFQLDVIGAPIGGVWAVLPSSPFTGEYTLVGGEAIKHNYLELADLDAINTTVSTMYKVRFTRIAEGVDDYGLEVYIDYHDSHVSMDTIGSLKDDSKV